MGSKNEAIHGRPQEAPVTFLDTVCKTPTPRLLLLSLVPPSSKVIEKGMATFDKLSASNSTVRFYLNGSAIALDGNSIDHILGPSIYRNTPPINTYNYSTILNHRQLSSAPTSPPEQ
jgi:hypothetical protein